MAVVEEAVLVVVVVAAHTSFASASTKNRGCNMTSDCSNSARGYVVVGSVLDLKSGSASASSCISGCILLCRSLLAFFIQKKPV